MQMIKFEKKYSHKRKGVQGVRGGNVYCINISETNISPAAPTKTKAARAVLGKPPLGVALKHVCSLVMEHVPKRPLIREKRLDVVWMLQLPGVLCQGVVKTSEKSMCS